ncbi:TPA: peptide chain release factor N(5)-glutamine methyltransferase [Citrobacter farmeri]|uniref:Protein-(Glutamine-N5) methyltransferase, release factor-specific n=2 Tax=Citrobacter farmeri TaxID=67824 RepID=A0ACA8D7K3_9ENTR|nr:peptide chain release factor N(5)-glutamine methyltransferase [Citrobacter farmeri]HAT2166735.1 peptide chain release factor N(5)-glutamine methyltransferase [Citrobacter freundii]AST80184.1 protein-(glutamine-N5) methyltransferase, release factor-specific [Citrobacter farmeri]EKV7296865.1 peptide chain release factor N(5)-glutamine methyltransferase [Citrobacter farmeri]MBJ8745037.1 peptide chain release factor N(5)-glutamine methyltransferase [Citrobacter farmeri]MBJ8758428.1 peptide chai
MDFQHWLHEAISQLQESESPRRDAEILLEFVTGKGRTYLLAFGETPLTDVQQAQLATLLARRQRGEPIAHLTGVREFWSLPLFVSPATLIPRPDTECLVEQALARLPSGPCRILDLGTGTGAIALALASERPDCEVTAVDRMPDAVELAQRNAAHLAINNIHIQQSDWFSALPDRPFTMIVSNPPYIDEQDPHLTQGDVRFEPLTALVAGDSGMADIVHIIEQSRARLEAGGFLLLEHGWQQGAAVRDAFIRAGYQAVETCRDYGDNERITLGRKPV